MRCEILSDLTSFHIVRQGVSGRGITSVIDTPTTCLPNCTNFSLLCARLALSILILAYRMWITTHLVCTVIKTAIQYTQTPEGAGFWPQPACLPSTGLLFVVIITSGRFCGLQTPAQENPPWSQKSLSLTGTDVVLLCFLDPEMDS